MTAGFIPAHGGFEKLASYHAGNPFWGCSAHPDCRGTLPVAPVLPVSEVPP